VFDEDITEKRLNKQTSDSKRELTQLKASEKAKTQEMKSRHESEH
jgi:hypothetical protein